MGNNSVPKFIFRLSRFPVYRGSVLGRFYCSHFFRSFANASRNYAALKRRTDKIPCRRDNHSKNQVLGSFFLYVPLAEHFIHDWRLSWMVGGSNRCWCLFSSVARLAHLAFFTNGRRPMRSPRVCVCVCVYTTLNFWTGRPIRNLVTKLVS